MKVLINAYACGPNRGSEPGIGWHWSTEIAKYCQVIVITEGEYRQEIEEALNTLPQKDNIKFVYNNVADKVRLICKNQGDWRFYWYYRRWQHKTLAIAREICLTERIDIVHQLTMQGFREPGLLWKIKGPKFVWGPVGGVENIPLSYLEGVVFKLRVFCTVKNIINRLQFISQPNVYACFRHANVVISSTPGTQMLIKSYYGLDSILINDTGCDNHIYNDSFGKYNKDGYFHLIWVGKFDFRKQLGLALEILAQLKDLRIKLHILGNGDVDKYKNKANDLGVSNNCVWHGQVEHDKVNQCMQMADLFLFTSIHEATSTVIVEAIQNHLPIVCHDTCGFGAVVTNEIGRKIQLRNPKTSIIGFSNVIRHIYENRDLLEKMSSNCSKAMDNLTWESKAKIVVKLYKELANT